jgi:xylulokinase
MTVLSIDLGSSGVKVAVVDRAGAVLGHASAPLPTTFTADGGAEQDPELWWREIGACGRRALDGRGGDVEAIAVTTQYMSIIAIDERGHPLSNASTATSTSSSGSTVTVWCRSGRATRRTSPTSAPRIPTCTRAPLPSSSRSTT